MCGIFKPCQDATAENGTQRGSGDYLPALKRRDHVTEFPFEQKINLEGDAVGKELHHEVGVERMSSDAEVDRKAHATN